MVEAARHLQLAHAAKLTETRAFIGITQHMYPEITDEAMPIYTNGAAPKYEATTEQPSLATGIHAIREIRSK